jgi:hypothetical protein
MRYEYPKVSGLGYNLVYSLGERNSSEILFTQLKCF